MLSIDVIRNSMVGASSTNAKKSNSYYNSISQQPPKPEILTLSPSEAASMLYASGASGAARVTFSEQNTTPPSIYDFSKEDLQRALDEIKAERQGISYEGMSDAEIYNSIVKRYMDKFGADLAVPNMSRELIDSSTIPNINSPLMAMHGEILAATSYANNSAQILREANGYSGLSNSEITAKVREKYPEPNTVRDYMLMKWELQEMGIGDAAQINLILPTKICGMKALENPRMENEIWTKMLDAPATFDALEKIEADFVRGGKVIQVPDSVDIDFFLDYIGAAQMLTEKEYEKLKEQLGNMLYELLGGLNPR